MRGCEYYNVMLKNQRSDAWIQHNLNLMIEQCHIIPITISTIQQTHKIRNTYIFLIGIVKLLPLL